ncbi:hypothetical protein tb265_15520 [Gemmatimonadetes bacterium T265]|nr:hypothetical protein tb265_15520 [Gemmatimonadetes bacterium T265]
MPSFPARLSAGAVRACRAPAVRRGALRVAAARGRALVLLYHRVTPAGASPADVVPVVSTARFRAQLEALAAAGDVVPLAALDEPADTRRRPRFALTFDDDEPAHVEHALPVLRALGLPATFFLMGRALHGLGPPWWVLLEREIARRGLRATADALGVAAGTPGELAAACEGTLLAERVARAFAPGEGASLLSAADVRALAAAGMEVGFHTLHHLVLTGLSAADARAALHDGRAALAAAAGAAVERVSYPHGCVDARVAALARDVGYQAAYRTGGRPVATPVGARADRWSLGRWEPGPLVPDTLVAHAAFRLTLPAGAPRRSSLPASGARAAGATRRATSPPR